MGTSVTFVVGLIVINSASALIGGACQYSWQCGSGLFCKDKVCRRESCSTNSQCQLGELCTVGNVDGVMQKACFPTQSIENKSNPYCPGGGKVVAIGGNSLASCDLMKSCPGDTICNPQFGVCCSKLRTCPLPTKAMMNGVSGKPIMCQLKGGRVMPCPGRGYCETQTGFCCHSEEVKGTGGTGGVVAPPTKPFRGAVCTTAIGCDGGAACICSSRGICKCECPSEFGYTVASDGKTCQRVRRRLKEKCKTDMECSAAFSECATGGCRCKRGFQRDGDGGCKPITYQCVNKQSPQTKNDKIVTCSLRQQTRFSKLKKTLTSGEEVDNATISSDIETTTPKPEFEIVEFDSDMDMNSTFHDAGRDDCDEGFYCVPLFDNPLKPGYYQGFCCPSPSDIQPACPVGVAHETSHYPDFGCKDCPGDHYCHRDSVSTEKEICCPKPCVSLEDIYLDGQCYPLAYYGDSCFISAQCTYQSKPRPSDEFSESSAMSCVSGICGCPSGFSYADGECKRIMCTIGLRGEPSVDRNNNLIRCDRSSDCSQGFMCDPNSRVCCKGTNRCPSNHVETGEMCSGNTCKGHSDICYRGKMGIAKICCRPEDHF